MSLEWGGVGHACAAAAMVLTAATGPSAQQAPAFRSGVDLVNVAVTVTDRAGGLVTDLKAGDFEVREDGRPQAISHFLPGDSDEAASASLHLGVLLDVSGSMTEEIAFARTAAIKFLNAVTRAADITVVDFDTEVRAARFAQADFPRVVERIRQQKVSGWTALYDAIGVYLDGAAEQDGRTIMLLYTDGGDTRSALGLPGLIDLLKASDVTVYAVGPVAQPPYSTSAQQQMVLRRIADVTGGQAFFPASMKELDKVYERVLAEIRAAYTIGYLSTNTKADGAWRKVSVRLNKPGVRGARLRSRMGYFAPYRP